MITTIQAELKHVEDLIPLFEAYRIFYKQSPDPVATRSFLIERIERNESVIFLAYSGEILVGFTQLFPSFSSSTLQRLCILNDLYVDSEFRRMGIAKILLDRAKDYARRNSLKGLSLETGIKNPAQKLYEREGWIKDELFYQYFWKNE